MRHVAFVLILAASAIGLSDADLPAQLTDQEFWRLTEDLSEPNGTFGQDNLVSNEPVFVRLVPNLFAHTRPGGVYLGVGPEQNFTYIAAMRPRMAFIVDIRRGNLHLHLMYKALFELSANRSDFVARLFTKPRQASVSPKSTVTDLMNAYWDAFTEDEVVYAANLQAIQNKLTKTHAFPLSPEDLSGIAAVYRAFYWYGPSMTSLATLSQVGQAPPPPGRLLAPPLSYREIAVQADAQGNGLGYLASEDRFTFLKELHRRNLVVPVVGDFSGPKALRSVGAYIRERGATVTAFYLSNVEGYLQAAGTWPKFCANVATMPLDDASVFIRPTGSRRLFSRPLAAGIVPMAAEVKTCGTPAHFTDLRARQRSQNAPMAPRAKRRRLWMCESASPRSPC
jgi:hypothetical protein